MTEELKKYEKSIKKKYSFNWTPRYSEEISTKLNKTTAIPVVLQVFEQLDWDLVYYDDTTAEAKRRSKWDRWTEKIIISYTYGKLTIKSISLGNEMFDSGYNSKRVRLFIYVFQQLEKNYDSEAIAELEKEVEKENNWDDYEVPVKLPKPKSQKKPQAWIPIVGGIIVALVLGNIFALLTVKAIYIIGLFEVGVGLAFGFVLSKLIKSSNYSTFSTLYYLLIGMVLITYVSNQYFQYQLVLLENSHKSFSFLEFIQARFDQGFTIKGFNTGWIGLVVVWVVQLVLTYAIGIIKLTATVNAHEFEKVPSEVVNFAYYHMIKEKNEDQIRDELSKLEWSKKEDQDLVFQAIAALKDTIEINRAH